MNLWLSLTLCVTLLTAGLPPTIASTQAPPLPADGGGVAEPVEDEMTPAQEQAMWDEIQSNLKTLRGAGLLSAPLTAETVSYTFPLRLAPGLPDAAGFRVSAFSDHNPAGGAVLDYNGGTRTYDGHRGTDYALWPFGWNKLDAGEMQVVAAAAGTIVYKANVDPTDHNCIVSSNDPWNYIGLLHADGRLTLYGHMRYNSLTGKGLGQTVVQGEYLGTAGSSGNSSGPHLHFEVRYGSFSNAEWIDPYAGPNSQASSAWANQPAYYDSAINRLSTHSSPPASPDPCLPSTPNLKDSFTTPALVYFYAFYRDFQGALPTQLKIYRPDGSLYNAWQYTDASSFSSAWNHGWTFNFTAADPAGAWRFEATYNSQTVVTYFNLNAPPALTVTSPNGGELLDRHQAHSLTWADNFGGDVNILLYRNGVFNAALAYNTPSDGEFLWTPDPATASGAGYTLRISSVINPAVVDQSDAPFTLADIDVVTARNDFALTLVNTPVTIAALANDDSSLKNSLSITAYGNPSHGAVGLVNGKLVYTPAQGYLGSDQFSYTASTSTANASATVTVYVAAEILRSYLPHIR